MGWGLLAPGGWRSRRHRRRSCRRLLGAQCHRVMRHLLSREVGSTSLIAHSLHPLCMTERATSRALVNRSRPALGDSTRNLFAGGRTVAIAEVAGAANAGESLAPCAREQSVGICRAPRHGTLLFGQERSRCAIQTEWLDRVLRDRPMKARWSDRAFVLSGDRSRPRRRSRKCLARSGHPLNRTLPSNLMWNHRLFTQIPALLSERRQWSPQSRVA